MKSKPSIAKTLMRQYRGMIKTMDRVALQQAVKYCYRAPDSWTYRFKDDSVIWFHKGRALIITKEEALKLWKRV